MTRDWQRIETIFFDALERTGTERDRFVAESCAGDDALRGEVEAMLAAHEGERRLAPERWEEGADAGGAAPIGRRVGAYRIQRRIGGGGMGEVYLATRDDAEYEREVAVKLMRPGLHAAEMVERFRRERQILARLEHPNIASLLDGGITDDGQPYLVMPYVDGVPITDYCESRDLPLRERLRLFRTVCAAVQAAHVQLVVHRDLKPANILVTPSGEVKLLDFGIAKLLDPGSSPLATRPLERVMTPEHAAPEQVRGEPVTTATDVYALGVLLFQLLTGERPLRFPSSSASDVERVICEVEPVPPSTVAQQHVRAIRGDLDRIVLMALRKEPARRYQSAQELDDDIERHLSGQPVHAEHDTFRYRARKFAGRHRVGLTVVGLFTALVAASVWITLEQARRVRTERDRAVTERARAERVVGVLTELFQQANPFVVPGGDTLRVVDFIARSEDAIAAMQDEPEVQARMWEVLATIHGARGDPARARVLLERALALLSGGDGHATEVARVQHELALLTGEQEGPEAAVPLLRASLARHRELLGDDHPDVATAMCDLAGALTPIDSHEAARLLDAANDIVRRHPSSSDMALAAQQNALGALYASRGQYADARVQLEHSLDILRRLLPPDHPNVLTVSHNVATTAANMGDLAAAEAMHRDVLAARRRVLGDDNPAVAISLEGLGVALVAGRRYREATEVYLEALRINEATYGASSPQAANTLRNIGVTGALHDRAAEGLPYLDRAIAIDEASRSWTTGTAYRRLQRAFVASAATRSGESLAEARACVAAIDTLARDAGSRYRADGRVLLATILLARGARAEADTLLQEAVALHAAGEGSNPNDRALARALLALAREAPPDPADLDLVAAWGQVYPLQRALLDAHPAAHPAARPAPRP